jgi:hypothetical protein
MTRLRIVLGGGFLAGYPEGGGHWAAFLQYLLGLADLGHDVWWLEWLRSSGDPGRDRELIDGFFARMTGYGLRPRCAVLLARGGDGALASAEIHGMTRRRLVEIARSADLVWDFACALPPPILGLFRRRVLVDIDPGHLQVSALTVDLSVHEHDAFLTVGGKINDPDCEVPTLGVTWQPFVPFVYLPMWTPEQAPGLDAPFTSVTQWTWEELWLGDRPLSVSKRDAYLRYIELPRRSGRAFELAANLAVDDRTGDRERLLEHGWRLVHPHAIAGSIPRYQSYLAASRAEFACPKPIHRELRTGWFSDRSACYLASGRPVLIEDTGLGELLPTGAGLLTFTSLEEAVERVAEIDGDYARHSAAARDIAADVLDSQRCLMAMLAASERRAAPSPRAKAS